jgi:L-lactate dehydrogenase
MRRQKNPNRVVIVGCENVGVTRIYSLMSSEAIDELILIDEDSEKNLSAVMRLQEAAPTAQAARVWAGDYHDAASAEIVVIAAGEEQQPGETSFDLLARNASIIRQVMRELSSAKFDGIVLMITNPVDILAQVAQQESGLPFGKVIGSGVVWDAPQLGLLLEEETVENHSIQSPVDGELDRAEVATWCAARMGGIPLVDFCNTNCPDFGKMLESLKADASATIEHKSFTSLSRGSCVTKICEAILRDEQTILPVSTMTNGQYGIKGVYLNLPCFIGREGVRRIIEMPLDQIEQKNLQDSAALLKRTIEKTKQATVLTAVN